MYKSFYFFILIITLVTARANGQEKPSWWDEVDFDLPKKSNVVSQYFYITDNFLSPAYKSVSPEREFLFKKSIIGYTKLIEQFTDPNRHMVTAALAQYQIAQSYKELGNFPNAIDAYEKCFNYEKYINKPSLNTSDYTLSSIIDNSRKKIEAMK